MTEPDFDVIVIGGGPGGSCAATFLAQAGKKVLVLEKERFPRFHVGESLLPYNHAIFRELGLLPTLEAAGFPLKRGAQFHLADGSKGTGFIFRNGCFTRHSEAFQVERSKFDDLLLRHAEKTGAIVREGSAVERLQRGQEGIAVEVSDGRGAHQQVSARFVIDASGRANLTGNEEGLRVVNPKLKKLAVFAHFEGVALDPGEKSGDTVIVRLQNKWFWLIPLRLGDGARTNKVSVGLVLDREEFSTAKGSPEETFRRFVASSPAVARRMETAELASPFHITSDFSYCNRSFWSSRVVRVGDAAGFIDPIFSSGVFIAMFSARLASKAVISLLDTGGDGSSLFPAYEKRIRAAMRVYWEMVENFYTTPFMEVFLEPRAKWKLDAAIVAILAGDLEGGWRLSWRMRLFFWLVKLQAKRPFMPRITFAGPHSA